MIIIVITTIIPAIRGIFSEEKRPLEGENRVLSIAI
jgi:hypothetical protein